MTLTASLLLDLVILVLFLSFFFSGLRRGLILSLCDLLAVVVGLLGGWYLADTPELVAEFTPFFAQRLSGPLSELAAKAVIFLLGFVIVQFVWNLFCRALDLVARLPLLHGLNQFLGGALGLVKGFVFLLVAQWALCDFLRWIPPEVAAESRLLTLLDTVLSLLPLPVF